MKNRRLSKRNVVTMLLLLSLTGACSKVKKAENNMTSMNNNTTQMLKTTNGMATSTKNLEGKTTATLETMRTMFSQVRIGDSRQVRRAEKESALRTTKMSARLENAAVFYKALEFQFWTNMTGLDNNTDREVMIEDAFAELIKTLNELYVPKFLEKDSLLDVDSQLGPKNKKARNLKVFDDYNHTQAFYAFAASMHENNHFQEDLNKVDPSFEQLSFYDLLKNAMRKEAAGATLDEMTEGEDEILAYMPMLEAFIQARVDIITTLAIKQLVSDKDDMKLGERLSGLLFKLTNGTKGKLKLSSRFTEVNNSQRRDINRKLDAAVSAYDFGKEIGLDLKLDISLHSILENLSIAAGEIAEEESDLANDVLFIEFNELLSKIRDIPAKKTEKQIKKAQKKADRAVKKEQRKKDKEFKKAEKDEIKKENNTLKTATKELRKAKRANKRATSKLAKAIKKAEKAKTKADKTKKAKHIKKSDKAKALVDDLKIEAQKASDDLAVKIEAAQVALQEENNQE
jgi:hypothetical protein